MVTVRRKPDFKKNLYEQQAWVSNQVVCGVDEVGRGCLAGPVGAAAVVMHPGYTSRLIKDSKELTPEERERAYAWIIRHSFYAVAALHHRRIDEINIYHATLVAMKRAVMQLLPQLPQAPVNILVDALPLQIATFSGDIIAFPYGESKSLSIAAASIVAKVTRDALMERLDRVFPGYLLGKHKGYSTPEHRAKIEELQPTLIHRKSFKIIEQESTPDETLFR
jgi:ribonuclease HII